MPFKQNPGSVLYSFVKVVFFYVSDEHSKLYVAMGTGLRDMVKVFMDALDLTALIPHMGWSCEELRWRRESSRLSQPQSAAVSPRHLRHLLLL